MKRKFLNSDLKRQLPVLFSVWENKKPITKKENPIITFLKPKAGLMNQEGSNQYISKKRLALQTNADATRAATESGFFTCTTFTHIHFRRNPSQSGKRVSFILPRAEESLKRPLTSEPRQKHNSKPDPTPFEVTPAAPGVPELQVHVWIPLPKYKK